MFLINTIVASGHFLGVMQTTLGQQHCKKTTFCYVATYGLTLLDSCRHVVSALLYCILQFPVSFTVFHNFQC